MKLTRRQLATGAAAAIAAHAQAPARPDTTTPEAELQNAKDRVRTMVQLLSQVEVPMTTEPAFAFQA